MQPEVVDAVGAKVGTALTYSGGTAALIFGGLSVNDWAAICGMFVAISGLISQIYFKVREDKRRARYWEKRDQLDIALFTASKGDQEDEFLSDN